MNLIWRFIITFLRAFYRPKLGLLEKSHITFHVMPTDVDALMHMNNGRYFSFLDLSRLDYIIRCDLYNALKKHKIYSVVASEMIRFRRSINLFKAFTVTTKMLGWDDRFLYIEHHFISNNEIHAIALVKGCFLQKDKGSIAPAIVVEKLNIQLQQSVLPEWVHTWKEADKAFHDEAVK